MSIISSCRCHRIQFEFYRGFGQPLNIPTKPDFSLLCSLARSLARRSICVWASKFQGSNSFTFSKSACAACTRPQLSINTLLDRLCHATPNAWQWRVKQRTHHASAHRHYSCCRPHSPPYVPIPQPVPWCRCPRPLPPSTPVLTGLGRCTEAGRHLILVAAHICLGSSDQSLDVFPTSHRYCLGAEINCSPVVLGFQMDGRNVS